MQCVPELCFTEAASCRSGALCMCMCSVVSVMRECLRAVKSPHTFHTSHTSHLEVQSEAVEADREPGLDVGKQLDVRLPAVRKCEAGVGRQGRSGRLCGEHVQVKLHI